MKVAVLGTGFGTYHTQIYAKRKDVESIIVWGRNESKLQELQKKYHVEITNKMEEIWNNQEIDLVDICLPNNMHKEMAVKALCSGKHVFIETPVTENLEDAEVILQTARQYGKRAFVDLFMRFEYAYRYLRDIVESKKYGQLKELQVKRETPPWWGNLDSEHIGLNLMIHDIDFIVSLMGEPDTVLTSKLDIREQQSILTACLQYHNACALARGASTMTGTYPFSVGYEAVLEHAVVRYYNDGYPDKQVETKLELFSDDRKEEIALQQTDCYEAVIEHVLQCIKDNRESCLDIEEAIHTLNTVLRMNRK